MKCSGMNFTKYRQCTLKIIKSEHLSTIFKNKLLKNSYSRIQPTNKNGPEIGKTPHKREIKMAFRRKDAQ